MNSKLIGSRIKERRKELGITLQEIADKIKVNKSTIQRYENGNIKDVKTPIIEAIASFLNVNPLWLLGEAENKTHSEEYEKATHLMNLYFRSVEKWSEDQLLNENETVIIREHFYNLLSHYKQIVEKFVNVKSSWENSKESFTKLYEDRLSSEEIRELFLKNELERELENATGWIDALPNWVARNEKS